LWLICSKNKIIFLRCTLNYSLWSLDRFALFPEGAASAQIPSGNKGAAIEEIQHYTTIIRYNPVTVTLQQICDFIIMVYQQ
jgi:hypothetical protein